MSKETIKRYIPVEIALAIAIPSATKWKSTTFYLTGKREKKLLLKGNQLAIS
jgi:hypothetical protein